MTLNAALRVKLSEPGAGAAVSANAAPRKAADGLNRGETQPPGQQGTARLRYLSSGVICDGRMLAGRLRTLLIWLPCEPRGLMSTLAE